MNNFIFFIILLLLNALSSFSQNELRQIKDIYINEVESKLLNDSYALLVDKTFLKEFDNNMITVYYDTYGLDSLSVYVDDLIVLDTIFNHFGSGSFPVKLFEHKKEINKLKIISHNNKMFFEILLNNKFRSVIITPIYKAKEKQINTIDDEITLETIEVVEENNYIDLVYLKMDYYFFRKYRFEKFGW